METSLHAAEVAKGERFEFGKNWAQFLEVLNDQRIRTGRDLCQVFLEVEYLNGKRFLDMVHESDRLVFLDV